MGSPMGIVCLMDPIASVSGIFRVQGLSGSAFEGSKDLQSLGFQGWGLGFRQYMTASHLISMITAGVDSKSQGSVCKALQKALQ